MQYYVYIIKSVVHGKRYIGLTSDISKRLADYNAGRSKYTKGHRPWLLIYSETFDTSTEARKRERYLKSGKVREILRKKLEI